MVMNLNDTVTCFYINLDRAADRRESMESQIAQLGLDFTRIRATTGDALDPELIKRYDERARMHEFPFGLIPNEHACVHSHLRALKAYLDTGAPYGLICEDDCIFEPGFRDGLEYAITKTRGWEVLRLYSDHGGKRTDLLPPHPGAPFELVFPSKVIYVAVCLLYTRKGAQAVLDGFRRYSNPYDFDWGRILLGGNIPVCGIYPNIARTSNPNNETSSISTADQVRLSFDGSTRQNLRQLLTRRLWTWYLSYKKRCMCRLLKRVLYVEDTDAQPKPL